MRAAAAHMCSFVLHHMIDIWFVLWIGTSFLYKRLFSGGGGLKDQDDGENIKGKVKLFLYMLVENKMPLIEVAENNSMLLFQIFFV